MHRAILEILAAILSSFVFAPASSHAQQSAQAENWCSEAERSLTDKDGKPIACAAVAKRCIKMNNYWCQKHGASAWRGTAGKDGKDGNGDVDGHAIFESVEWSARAIAIDLRAKYRRGLVSAVQLSAAHSPWCDTLGSKAVASGSGRTCKDGRAAPPPDFSGPLCEAPKSIPVSEANCRTGCNCPPSIAAQLVRGLSIDINADLKLFDKEGNPLPNLALVIRNLAFQEQSVYVKQSVVEAGISKLTQ
jgi:hypothetical protein